MESFPNAAPQQIGIDFAPAFGYNTADTRLSWKGADMKKRKFSTVPLEETMPLLGAEQFLEWQINAPPRSPSASLQEHLRRLERFDTAGTSAAKLLLVDALLMEIVPNYPSLKVWKGETLETATMKGRAAYLITPPYAYMKTPLLCATEAKRDNFVRGRARCLAEMTACRELNQADGQDIDPFGFVSNGRAWWFYKLTAANEIYETRRYGGQGLPELLGVLDAICAECAKRVS